jgi:hypothetical protein
MMRAAGACDRRATVPGMSRVVAVLAAGALAACASSPPPAAAPRSEAATPAPPAEAPRVAFWTDVKSKDYAVPPGSDPAALVPELEAWLASPDPVRRDELALEVLAAWISDAKVLAPPALQALAQRRIAALAAPHDPAPDAVFGRSFSALTLSIIVGRDLATPFLSADEVRAQLAAAAAYAATEADLRGHVGAQGWAHAAAHTGDWLRRLARHPAIGSAEAPAILGAVADLVVRRHGHNLHHGEDGRLAEPVLALARRDLVDAASLGPWTERLLAPFREKGPHDPARYAAQRNARNLLFTLFVMLSLEDKPTAGTAATLAAVKAAIAS